MLKKLRGRWKEEGEKKKKEEEEEPQSRFYMCCACPHKFYICLYM
jgi:DNA-directed RNA polymerase subunit M/transcription elongation factor TFIIS